MTKALGQFVPAEVEGVTMGMQTYHVALEQEDGWYVVQCVELPGAISQGRTREEALANIKEAIELLLEHRTSKFAGQRVEEVVISG
jgi:predicted RNase H-like HicB family nuclease